MDRKDESRIDQERASRRRFLAAAAGGVAAAAAASLGAPAPANAADGGPVLLGSDTNTAVNTTVVNCSTAGFSALWGHVTAVTGFNVGVRGDVAGPNGYGIWGIGSSAGAAVRAEGGVNAVSAETDVTNGSGVYSVGPWGVVGTATVWSGILGRAGKATTHGVIGVNALGTGVAGYAGNVADSIAAKPKTGVYGESLADTSSRGVYGRTNTGQGVRGEATSGIAVYGVATSQAGYGLRSSGRVRFDKVSGVASIAAGATSTTITPGVDVAADSFVLLTAKSNIGSRSLYFSVDATNNTITIWLSSSRTAATSVAWLLLK